MSQESPLMEKIRMAKISLTDLRRFDDGVNMLREMIEAVLIEHDALAARVAALEKQIADYLAEEFAARKYRASRHAMVRKGETGER